MCAAKPRVCALNVRLAYGLHKAVWFFLPPSSKGCSMYCRFSSPNSESGGVLVVKVLATLYHVSDKSFAGMDVFCAGSKPSFVARARATWL